MKNMQERQRWSATLQGKYFNVLGHFFSLYCMWKIFICTINIIFDRVGKKDVVTRGKYFPYLYRNELDKELDKDTGIWLMLYLIY